MSNLAVMVLVECEARCGARVRPGLRYCTRCEEMAVEFEAKRLKNDRERMALQLVANRMEAERKRRQHDTVCEASDFPTILCSTTLRERMEIGAVCALTLAVGGGLAFVLWLGAKQAVGMLLRLGS